MKNFNVLLIAAAAIFSAGCTKEKTEIVGGNKKNGVLTISIKSEKHARALVDGTTVIAADVAAFEGNVANFSAYVFNWDTGDLEASATSDDGTPATITGLNTAGTKRIVVIANGDRTNLPNSFIPQFENDPNYSRIADGYLALADQSFTDFTDLSKGFLMTGENATAIQLVPGTNTTEITVKRVVAKVQLGEITFDDDVQLTDLVRFNLTGASIQRAATYSTLGTGAIATPSTPSPAWAGGYLGGSISNITNIALANTPLDLQAFLTSLYTTKFAYTDLADPTIAGTFGDAMSANDVPADDAVFSNAGFWYVLPSADSEKFTLLTLKGSYDGSDFFYPIEINDPDATGNAEVDGSYVKRNTIYTINIHFKHFVGIADPDLPGVAASLEVTVDPADWEGPVVQDATW